MGDIIQPFNHAEAGHGDDSPIAEAEIGGFAVTYFKKPGLGVSPPPKETYRTPDGKSTDYQKMAGDTLKWTADKTVEHGIIHSAVVRELLTVRAERKELSARLKAATAAVQEGANEIASLRLEFANTLREIAEAGESLEHRLAAIESPRPSSSAHG